MKKSGPGRRTKLTPELEADLLQLLGAGNYIKTACQVVGIDQTTYQNWMKNPVFRAKVEQVMAKAEADIVVQWQNFTAEDWRACKEFLAARYSKNWGRKDALKVEASTKVDASDLLKEMEKGDQDG